MPPSLYPIHLDFSTEGTPEPIFVAPPPDLSKMNKYLEKFLAMGKDIYFESKATLRGRVIHPNVRDFSLVQKFC